MKSLLKLIANSSACLLMFPWALLYETTSQLLGAEKVFPGFSQGVSLIPGQAGIYLRRAFYLLVLKECRQDACISFGTVFSHPGITIGQTTYLGVGCMIGDVDLADDVLVGSHVSIINGNRQHGIDRLDLPVREQGGEYPRITIGRDSWIGDRSVIMADVGQHCVIGAGSVLTKPLKDYEIAVGNPARVIGTRTELAQRDDSSTPPAADSQAETNPNQLTNHPMAKKQ